MSNLSGKRILVTRPRAQAESLVDMLADLGAIAVVFPTIEISAPEDTRQLDQAIQALSQYQWVIFTSVNGVAAFWERLNALGKTINSFEGLQVAAIGPATALALQERGLQPDFVPQEYVAEAILPGLGEVHGRRILLPRADIARKALVTALNEQGAFPDEIAVYRTLPAQLDEDAVNELSQGVDVATFTSSSTVRNFFRLLGERALPLLGQAHIACIGPITAETARACGLHVDIIADEYTTQGLVNALLSFYHTPA